MIRTAIVAIGFSSTTFHIPFILSNPNYKLSALVTSKPEQVIQTYPHVTVVTRLEQLDLAQLDLVIITSPNSFHYSQACYCLERAVPVVVEKPLVTNSTHAAHLQAIARQNGVSLTVFQNRRWDGDFLTVKRLLEAGSIGELKRFSSRFDRFRPQVRQRWREQAGEGAGILWDLGPHLVDQVVALFGEPLSVLADVKTMRAGAVVDDNFDIRLDYKGFDVVLGSSSFQAGPNPRFVVEGDLGSFVKYGLDVQEEALKQGFDVNAADWGQEPEESWGSLYTESETQKVKSLAGAYGDFWNLLAEHLTTGTESPVPLAEAVCVIRILELARLSAKRGCRVEFSGETVLTEL